MSSAEGILPVSDAHGHSQFSGAGGRITRPESRASPNGCNDFESTLPSHNRQKRLPGLLLGWRLILMGSWLNVLLVFIPISYILGITHPNSRGLTFTFSILSLIPLVKLHDVSTRELAVRIGGSKTGLVNASMSNIVEMFVAISALRKCELRVVQSSLIGSMLSKLLLVLGLCLFAGGLRFSEQDFDATATQIHSSLLSLSVGAVLLPAAYHFALGGDTDLADNILHMSHGVAIVLLFIYGSYLFFQLWSHPHLYQDGEKSINRGHMPILHRDDPPLGDHTREYLPPASPSGLSPPKTNAFRSPYLTSETVVIPERNALTRNDSDRGGTPIFRDCRLGSRNCSSNGSSFGLLYVDHYVADDKTVDEALEDKSEPQLSLFLTLMLLTLVTVAVASIADILVESMDSISTTIRKEWVALILLPAVSSVAECITAVNVSVKDQLNFAISVAVGSTIQIALFVIPFMVTLAWLMSKPLALLFDPFESLVLYISVQIMTYVMADGKSNYLEGIVLLCLYIIIAVSFWFYPVSNLSTSLGVCTVT